MNCVIVNCFDTYEHRVDLLHDFLVESGHNVLVLTSDYLHFEKRKRAGTKTDYVFLEAKPYKRNLSFSRLSSHIRFAKDVRKYLENNTTPVELIWALIPPNMLVKELSEYKYRHPTTKLVYDLIDLWPETMPIGSVKSIFPFTVWKNLRNKHICEADYVVTECHLFQNELKTILKDKNTKTVYLARQLIPYSPKLNTPSDRISICYLGSINNIIDTDIIASVISELKTRYQVEFHIIGDGERRKELIDLASSAGADVIFHGKIYSRDGKQEIFDTCHFGLNIMKPTVCVGLTMKSIDYLEFGLPIINNIKGDTWKLIERYGFGVNTDKLADINLEDNYEYRKKARSFFETNLTIEHFNQNIQDILGEI